MVQLLFGVDLELAGDVHVLGAAEHLGIDDVGDDCLVLAGQVLVQELRELVAGDVNRVGSRVCHSDSSFFARLYFAATVDPDLQRILRLSRVGASPGWWPWPGGRSGPGRPGHR